MNIVLGLEMLSEGKDMLSFTKMVSVACDVEVGCVGGGGLLQVDYASVKVDVWYDGV